MPWWLPAAVKGVTTGIQYLTRPKRGVTTTPFAETTYGKHLKRREETGLYPPSIRGKMLRRYGETISSGTQRERAGISGGLVSRGMHGSISGLRALGAPERRRTGLISGYGKELDIESELGGLRAGEEYARLSTMTEERRRAEEEQIKFQESQAKWGLLGGLGEAGMGLYSGLMGKKLAQLGAEEGKEYGSYAPYVFAQQGGIRAPAYGFRGLMEESPEEKKIKQLQLMEEFLRERGLID